MESPSWISRSSLISESAVWPEDFTKTDVESREIFALFLETGAGGFGLEVTFVGPIPVHPNCHVTTLKARISTVVATYLGFEVFVIDIFTPPSGFPEEYGFHEI